MTVLRPEAFVLLVPAVAVVGVSIRFELRARLWRERFEASSHASGPQSLFPGRLRIAVLAVSLFCVVCALSRPVWNPHRDEATEAGQDALFLVDVSRSMNTADLGGGLAVSASGGSGVSRLDAVKNALSDLVPTLSGDRTALVAFAGTSVPKCPLTTDRVFFSNAVRLLDAGSTSRGGTLLGDALRMVKKNFVSSSKNLAVWVFTDGGDQESFPVEAAQALADSGVRLYIWGVGSTTGAEVPERGVVSALDEELLRQVAAAVPGGEYFGSGTPLWRLSAEYSARRKPTSSSTSTYTFWDEGSWFLLWPVFFLLLALPLVRAVSAFRPGKTGRPGSNVGSGPGGSERARTAGRRGGSARRGILGRFFSTSIIFTVMFATSCSAPANGSSGSNAASASGAAGSPAGAATGGQSGATAGTSSDVGWQSPADEAALARLSRMTMEKGLSRPKRAQLLYLYGQETAASGNTGAAIAAFERIVDLGSILSDESRINLEILYQRREQEEQEKQQQQQEQQKNGQQDGEQQQNGDQKDGGQQKDGSDGKQNDGSDGDQQNAEQHDTAGQQQNADQSSAGQNVEQDSAAEQSSAAKPKDMSGLVREKAGNSALEQALRAEAERMNQKQQLEAGNAVPVEKDW